MYVDPVVARVAEQIRNRLQGSSIPERSDLSWLPSVGVGAVQDGPLTVLTDTEADVMVAAGLIELDIRWGSLFAVLQEPLRSGRPCIGLLAWLLGGTEDVTAICQDLVRRGLLAVDNPTDPRSEWSLRVAVPVWDLIRTGRVDPMSLPEGLTLRTGFPALAKVAVAASQVDLLSRVPRLLAQEGLTALVVRGRLGSGRTTLLGAAAATLGLDVLVHDVPTDGPTDGPTWPLFEALSALCPVLPVLRADPAPGETLRLPTLHGSTRPTGVVLGRSGGVSGPALEHALTVTLEPCGPDERRLLWDDAGLDPRVDHVEEIVDRFVLTPGNIRRAGPVARLQALGSGRAWVTAEDVRAATRTLRRQELETLATFQAALPGTDAPVLTATAQAEFDTLLRRCRHRERLVETATRSGVTRGVRALFSGGSGTGKTLAARHLAAMLDLDLYVVNLAAVVNKYVGETERNLDRVLARAEELDVVLLLDEGDALMTRRTDVGNANDRYANLETDFLLQRLESFDGIVVVTSNAASRIDQAFLRRIDVTVDFVAPDADARWQIWAAHLPADHDVSAGLLDDVARRCALTGGQIRNASLHATLLALDNGGVVSDAEVLAGIRREYQRSGSAYPLAARTDIERGSRNGSGRRT